MACIAEGGGEENENMKEEVKRGCVKEEGRGDGKGGIRLRTSSFRIAPGS